MRTSLARCLRGDRGPPLIPRVGPALFSVAGFAGQTIGAGASLGPVAFQWPRMLFCTGLLVLPRSGSAVDLAALSVRIQDESFADMFSDGQILFRAPALALQGFGLRPFPLQRPVMTADEWRITVTNASGAGIDLACVALLFEEGAR
jgi:hypothetical protein